MIHVRKCVIVFLLFMISLIQISAKDPLEPFAKLNDILKSTNGSQPYTGNLSVEQRVDLWVEQTNQMLLTEKNYSISAQAAPIPLNVTLPLFFKGIKTGTLGYNITYVVVLNLVNCLQYTFGALERALQEFLSTRWPSDDLQKEQSKNITALLKRRLIVILEVSLFELFPSVIEVLTGSIPSNLAFMQKALVTLSAVFRGYELEVLNGINVELGLQNITEGEKAAVMRLPFSDADNITSPDPGNTSGGLGGILSGLLGGGGNNGGGGGILSGLFGGGGGNNGGGGGGILSGLFGGGGGNSNSGGSGGGGILSGLFGGGSSGNNNNGDSGSEKKGIFDGIGSWFG